MVSSMLFYHVSIQKVNGSSKAFGNLSVIVCGDFYQFMSFKEQPIYSCMSS